MNRLLVVVFAITVSTLALAQKITVQGLVSEMTDLRRLCVRPSVPFTAAQASSYDRKSKNPQTEWFANADCGQFIRQERTADRTEWVMADLKGPGAVMRIWSANPKGTIRFYFDGEPAPRLEASMQKLLSGGVPPFHPTFSYVASRGANLYFPLPYAKSLRITVDQTEGVPSGLYYQIGFRTYPPGTAVESFSLDALRLAAPEMATAAETLGGTARFGFGEGIERSQVDFGIAAGTKQVLFETQEGAVIVELRASLLEDVVKRPWNDPRTLRQLLRSVLLFAEFDGELCIAAPLGDFFAAAPGTTPFSTYLMSVSDTGQMTCRFPMPFAKSARVWLENRGRATAFGSMRISTMPFSWNDRAYHFKAQWGKFRGSTRPMFDMNFLKTRGEGAWIGSVLSIANPVPNWWGEGDEKVYVDSETFPSTFGTGTEDYYGYAWCDPTPFSKPFHAQPRCDGPGNFGHTTVLRWHVLDPIPFTSAFQFDMEMWHWSDVNVEAAHTAYWYALPGGPPPRPIVDRDLGIPELTPPKPVLGALEGEAMEVISRSGGKTEIQSGFFELSAGKQLWWTQTAPGDRLQLQFQCPKEGRYRVIARLCNARDYGIHTIRVNAGPGVKVDCYGEGVTWKNVDLGVMELPRGSVQLEVQVVGRNPSAVQDHMFGLDYVILKKP